MDAKSCSLVTEVAQLRERHGFVNNQGIPWNDLPSRRRRMAKERRRSCRAMAAIMCKQNEICQSTELCLIHIAFADSDEFVGRWLWADSQSGVVPPRWRHSYHQRS